MASKVRGRPLNVFVTVGDDGYGVLTMLRPVIAPVMLADRQGIYARPGDMVLLRHLCPEGLALVLGKKLAANEPHRCRLTLELVDTEEVAGRV